MRINYLLFLALSAILVLPALGFQVSTPTAIPFQDPPIDSSGTGQTRESTQPFGQDTVISGSTTTAARSPKKGLPEIATLPTKVARVFRSNYPSCNEGEMDRIAVDLHTPTVVEVDLPNATPAFAVWRMVGPVRGLVLQNEAEPAVGDMSGLIDHLTRDAQTDREKALAIFGFVRENIEDWWFPTMRGDLTTEDLNKLIWTFGYGYCYDLSRLVTGLWAQAGLRARIVNSPRHTVAEVFYDKSWHLFDAQHHTYYSKPDGQIASFEELKADTSLFYQNLNVYGLDEIGYPPHHLAQWYSEWEPRFEDSLDQAFWKIEAEYSLNLREGEYLDITYAEPGPTFHPNAWVIFYGLGTNRKDPPSPYKGKICYSPARNIQAKTAMPWTEVQSPSGTKAWMVEMNSPFVMSEGYLEVPGGAYLPHGWVVVNGLTTDLGRVPHGKIHLSKYIAGATQFQVILEIPEEQTIEEAHLTDAFIEVLINLSQVGLPRLHEGVNRLPIRFMGGDPHFTAWFKKDAPDLTFTKLHTIPEHPAPGTTTELVYTVTNKGSGRSQPTSLTVFNNVTAFLSETTQKVGTQMVPPLEPGESAQVTFYWEAGTQMTWYGQNPYVQIFDAWIDMERDRIDSDPSNNNVQDYVLLQKEDGTLPELPGYGKL